MSPPSPRSEPVSAAEVDNPFRFMEALHNSRYDSYQTTHPPNIPASETEAQVCSPYSSDFHTKDISVLPVETYINALEYIYKPSTLTDSSHYDEYLSSHVWASETPAELHPNLAGAIYPPPIPAHSISIPSTTSSDGFDPISSHAWQFNAGPLMQTDLGISWWHGPWPGTGSGDQTTLPSRLKTGCTTTHKPESTSTSEAKEYGGGHESRTDSTYPGPPRKKKKLVGPGSFINSNASALTTDLSYSSDSATTPMPLNPGVSFDSADTETQTNPRRSRSSRTASSASEEHRARQSPTPATSRPEQRARNRIAANKCRTKTKAAVAELEATAKEEASRHEQLSISLRGLQAEVFALKSEILMHGACGDGLIQDYLNSSARSLVAESGPDQVSHWHAPSSGSMQLRC